ncbi:MAG: hypothetical protein H0T62_07905 [Parachlamydiaceae bacterium]|nr:hypothetical protein [Parachlamydiaceae bacterium]
MDPISISQFSSIEDQPLTCCKVISGIVAVVSAVSVAIFGLSTYCIITYGAPLAFVACVANPLMTAGIAIAAALVFIFALSILSAKSEQIIIMKRELQNDLSALESKNRPMIELSLVIFQF